MDPSHARPTRKCTDPCREEWTPFRLKKHCPLRWNRGIEQAGRICIRVDSVDSWSISSAQPSRRVNTTETIDGIEGTIDCIGVAGHRFVLVLSDALLVPHRAAAREQLVIDSRCHGIPGSALSRRFEYEYRRCAAEQQHD